MFYCEVSDDDGSGGAGQNVSVKQYETEWRYLFNATSIDKLQNIAINGELRTCRFRSVYWRLLLGILPSDSNKWLTCIEEHRSTYERIKLAHYNNPHAQDSGPDNPLSQDDHSVWNQYFKDMELRKIILQDVVRTSPGVEFFNTTKIRHIMIDILFYYSREHPELCYRQGMHEILAPLLFVIHCDHQALLHVLEQLSPDICDVIKKILDPAFLEADVYSLFCTIMEVMKDYYNVSDCMMSSIVLEQSETVKVASSTSESEVVRKLSKIRDKTLMKHDPELYAHLIDLDISFTTFGVRWLRLLFGGEFSLMDLLVLWDTIFAKSPQNFAIVNHIFVAMLVLIRVQLLKSDNINCLNYLMRYPHVDVMSIIDYALHISDPKTYALPSVIDSLKHDKQDNLKSNFVEDPPERPSKLVSNLPSRRTYNSSDDLLELCRIKLLQYHSILSPVVPNHNKEARQALSGILELCGMLNTRPGIIEMGKDVMQSTTPLQTPVTPESPGGPLLPPPASSITMKVFRKTESSIDSQILGAPTKNPLKQMKRFEQDYNSTDGISAKKRRKVVQFNKMYINRQESEHSIQIDRRYNNNNIIKRKKENHIDDIENAVNINSQQNWRNYCIVKQDTSFTNVKPRIVQQNIIKGKLYSKLPACSYVCLISLTLSNSPTGFMQETEIFEFVYTYFPYIQFTSDWWRYLIRKYLHFSLCFFQSKKIREKIFWYLNPSNVNKINRIIMNWAIGYRNSIKNLMSNPDQLEILLSCISLNSSKNNCTTEKKVNNNLEKENLLTSDSDDDPYREVTLTSNDVANLLNDIDQYQPAKSKVKNHHRTGVQNSYLYNVKDESEKLSTTYNGTTAKEQRQYDQYLPAKSKVKNHHRTGNQNSYLYNVKDVLEKLSTDYTGTTAEEQNQCMQASLELIELHSKQNPKKKNMLGNLPMYRNNQTLSSQLTQKSKYLVGIENKVVHHKLDRKDKSQINSIHYGKQVPDKKKITKIDGDRKKKLKGVANTMYQCISSVKTQHQPIVQNRMKRPLCSFMLWSSQERCKMPKMLMTEASKVLSIKWKQMTEEEKKPYVLEQNKQWKLYKELNPHN